MVVPRFVGQAMRNEPITIYGDGTQRRCFCDVADVVRAIVGLALNDDASGLLFNIGNQEEVTIRDLAERAKMATGSTSDITYIPYGEAYPPGFEDMQRRVPDTTRIRTLLNWSPEFSLDQTLRRVRDDIAASQIAR
jgi:UDP-glucose 4-epimerase